MKKWWILQLRLIAFMIDFALPTLIVSTVFSLIVHDIMGLPVTNTEVMIWGYSLFISVMLKDLGGNSLGKRITGFKVISVIGDEKPKITQLLVRNLFVFFIIQHAVVVTFAQIALAHSDLFGNIKHLVDASASLYRA